MCSVATQTVSVEQLHTALKKETGVLGTKQLRSSAPSCSKCVTENKGIKEEPELYTNSSNFYQNPSSAYECMADIHRATAKYTSVATEMIAWIHFCCHCDDSMDDLEFGSDRKDKLRQLWATKKVD